jgi:hypothetical protein
MEKRDAEFNLKAQLDPVQFKIVASSPAALKQVKNGL